MFRKKVRGWRSLFCLLFFCTSPLPVAPVVKPIIVVYPAWKHNDLALKSLPWSNFSHVSISGVFPTDEGLLTQDADSFIQELVSLCHQNNKKVILSIGGAGLSSKGFIEITKDSAKFARFVGTVVRYVHVYGLDGIDIDWEYWTFQSELDKGGRDPVESEGLLRLVATLRSVLPESALLTVDIAPGAWLGDQYPVDLQKYVNYVNLMAFDFTGPWKSSKIGYHSNFSMFKKAVGYALDKGFRPDKLLVGLPAYGIEFVNGESNEVKHVDFREVVKRVNAGGTKLSANRLKNLYFENGDSIAEKCLYINKRKLAGVFLFHILSDHPSPEFSLLTACTEFITPL